MKGKEATLHAERRGVTHRIAAKTAPTDERLLVSQAKSGCSDAFAELYKRYRLRTYHTALRILDNRQDAEDTVQRSFQRAFINLGRFREDSSFLTWVTRIAINEALMLLRQRRALTPLSDSDNDGGQAPSLPDPPAERPTPEQLVAENEVRTALSQAISDLRENLRAVVVLKELQGLTNAETARMLGLTVSAVKARVFRARCYLRGHLERKYKLHTATA